MTLKNFCSINFNVSSIISNIILVITLFSLSSQEFVNFTLFLKTKLLIFSFFVAFLFSIPFVSALIFLSSAIIRLSLVFFIEFYKILKSASISEIYILFVIGFYHYNLAYYCFCCILEVLVYHIFIFTF